MIMGEQDGVDVGKIFYVHCWVCLACACDAWSKVDVIAGVEEIWLFVG